MASVGKLVVELEANIAKFSASFDQAVSKVNRSTAAITSSLKKIAAFSLAGLSVGKIIGDLKAVALEAKALEKLSIRLNIDPTQLSAMHEAAEEAGVGMEAFNKGLQFMVKNISSASLGLEGLEIDEDGVVKVTDKANKAFMELGLNVQKLATLKPEDQFKALIVAMDGVESEADKLRLSLAIFGKGGGGMTVLMQEGLANLEKEMQKAKETGKAFNDEQIAKAKQAYEAIDTLGDSWAGLKRELVLVAVPLSVIFDWITKIVQALNAAGSAMDKFAGDIFGGKAMPKFPGLGHGGEWEPPEVAAEPAKSEIPEAVRKRFEGYLAAGKRMDEFKAQYPELFGERVRPGKEGKGGKGGGGVDPFEQLSKTLDSLKTEKLSLVGTEFEKIDDWVRKTLEDIQQWGDLGELTAQAVATAWEISGIKRQEVEKDFAKWLADSQGDYTTAIDMQMQDQLKKWREVKGAEVALEEWANREKIKKASDYEQNRLNLTKQFLDELTATSPLLTDQLRLKEQTLAIDIQIGRERLKLLQFEPWMTDELWQQANALAAQVEKSRELALAREKFMTQGAWGGMQAWGMQRQIEAQTRPAQMMIDTMRALEQEIGAGMADAFIGWMRGKKQDISEVFFAAAEDFTRRAFAGLTAMLFDKIAPKPIVTPVITAGALNVATINAANAMGLTGGLGGYGGGYTSPNYGGFGALAGFENAALGGYEMPGGFEAMAEWMNEAMGQSNEMGSAITNFYGQQTSGWQSLVGQSGGWLNQLFNTVSGWFKSLLGGFGGIGGGGSLGSGLFSLFGGIGGGQWSPGMAEWYSSLLPAFQHGGSFKVPGAGGPDSKLVAFRATPGEQVDISRPGEDGKRIVVNVNQTFVTKDPASYKASRTQIAAQAASEIQRSWRNL